MVATWRDEIDGHPRTPEGARSLYDKWAADYDGCVRSWGYTLPERAASELSAVRLIPRGGEVRALDLGCGTGQAGAALVSAGVVASGAVDGADVSEGAMATARRKGAYGRLLQLDLWQLPLPFPPGSYSLVSLMAVLSYARDRAGLLREAARVAGVGGVVAFSHRSDRLAQPADGTAPALSAWLREGEIEMLSRVDDLPYCPGYDGPGYADVTVSLIAFRVLRLPGGAAPEAERRV
eukprot:TRINITY_DN70856_c0_g1_i1.p1 TRINITY_DN70856_c0_g1~~TRINITY_DN70856_c0_g1_i1.p1  ORF type:complete len:269 (+),score=45.05 TRINITY_DN70856_c0_g1_i1:100-807(+)